MLIQYFRGYNVIYCHTNKLKNELNKILKNVVPYH